MARFLRFLTLGLLMNSNLSAAPLSAESWAKLPPHPRLFANAKKWESLKSQIRTDPVSRDLFAAVQARADALLEKPVVVYQKEGRRLLGPARQALGRILSLAMAFRLTNDSRYAERAIAELRAAAALPDWNPSHFLDTAELTMAMAIGYDWLHDALSEADRKLVERAILEKGLRASVDSPAHQLFFINAINNWNQVCHGSLIAGALAIAPAEKELGVAIVNRALENLPIAAKAYAPDGAYAEGPMYWTYGTIYHVMLIELLRQALGSTFGTEKFTGFLESADFMAQAAGPTGRFFNYADGGDRRTFQPALFWFARERHQPSIVDPDLAEIPALRTKLRDGNYEPNYLFPLALLWWNPGEAGTVSRELPRVWVGRGVNPIAIHRTAWKDPQAGFLAIKGGRANSPHAHMDAGSFIYESDGVRWAVDTGMQDYNSLESRGLNLWSFEPDSDRWKVFRLGSESHNILRFNGKSPQVAGFAEIAASRVTATAAQTLVDLSAVYPEPTTQVMRGVKLHADRSIWIQDEWKTRDQPAEVTFQWLTYAAVSVKDSTLTLKQDGRSLALRVLTPRDAAIQVEDVSQPRADFDAPNPGLNRISIRVSTPARTDGRLAILAAPGEKAASAISQVLPLESWGWDKK